MNKGLFYNKIISSGINKKQGIVLFLIMLILAVTMKNLQTLIIYEISSVNGMIAGFIKTEKNNGYFQYIKAIPVKANKIVGTTFAFFYMIHLFFIGMILLTLIMTKLFGIDINVTPEVVTRTSLILICVSGLSSINIPIQFKYNVSLNGVAVILYVILIGAAVGMISSFTFETGGIILAVFFGAVIPIVSYLFSIKFVK